MVPSASILVSVRFGVLPSVQVRGVGEGMVSGNCYADVQSAGRSTPHSGAETKGFTDHTRTRV